MQLASTARTNSDNTRSSLSYVNSLITEAASTGQFFKIVDGTYMDDTMMNSLISDYGYKVTKEFFDMGTYPRYKIFFPIVVLPPTPTPTNTPTSTPIPTPTPTPNHVAGVDFTIEWWMKVNNWTSPTYHPRPYALGNVNNVGNAVSIEGGGNHFYWWGSGSPKVDYNGLNLQPNTWYHMAVTRDNGTLAIYVDGVRKATATYNDAMPSLGNSLMIGAEPQLGGGQTSQVNGKMTNFRWNASVKYTGASFTVPTSPLTADSNTKFLILATDSGHLTTDSSTFTRTITNSGASWSSDSPFSGGVGGSVNFAGTGYFTIPASSDWDL